MKRLIIASCVIVLVTVCQIPAFAQPATAFKAKSLSGEPISYSPNEQNTPVLLVVWASWCRYCLAEMPELIELAHELQDKLTILGINVDRNPQNGHQIVETRQPPYPSVSDPDLAVADKYKVRGTPDLILIDSDGIIVKRTNRLKKIKSAIQKLARQ